MDELIHMQSAALRKLINYSYNNVMFYRNLFDNNRLHPEEIRSIDDISKIPVIDKNNLNQYPPDFLINKKYNKNKLIPIKTAGSCGMPFLFYIDNTFDQYRKAQFLRPYLSNGRHLWDRSIIYSVLKPKKKKWFQQLGFMLDTKISPTLDLNDQIKFLRKIKPAVILGYGSVINLLAVKIIGENILIPKPKLIFTDSEILFPEMKKNIKAAFGADIIDIYGTFETDNIAYECCFHNGYHIAIDSVIMEFLKDGNPVGPNEDGEIVVTVLNNFCMPFIRYNLHDIGSYNSQSCLCGRTFPLMNQIMGRANDYMVKSDGRKYSFFNISRFETLAPHVLEYQIIQEDFDYFTLLIVPNKSYNNEGRNIILPAIKKYFPEAIVDIQLVPKIERENSGKFKAFKSMVKQ